MFAKKIKNLFVVFLILSINQFCGAMGSDQKSSEVNYNRYDAMWVKSFYRFYMSPCANPMEEPKFIMPDTEVLTKLFHEFGLTDLVPKTCAIDIFVDIGHEMTPVQILLCKYLALADYSRALQASQTFAINVLLDEADRSFDVLINRVLQDYPEAIKQLQMLRAEIIK